MKTAKRRPVANAQTQVLSFNKSSQPETIADHNDPYKVDWTQIEEGVEYYVGEKVGFRYGSVVTYLLRYYLFLLFLTLSVVISISLFIIGTSYFRPGK